MYFYQLSDNIENPASLFCLLASYHTLHSQPKSTAGTSTYIAPEVLLEYDGNVKPSMLFLIEFDTVINMFAIFIFHAW